MSDLVLEREQDHKLALTVLEAFTESDNQINPQYIADLDGISNKLATNSALRYHHDSASNLLDLDEFL